MNVNQEKMLELLKPYPAPSAAYNEDISAFECDDYRLRAQAMYSCAIAMTDVLFESCDADECNEPFDRLTLLYKAHFISDESYDNYLSIIDYKHNSEYKGEEDEYKILSCLNTELEKLACEYSAKLDDKEPLGKRRIDAFFYYRFAGFIFSLIGIAVSYNCYTDYCEDGMFYISQLITGLVTLFLGITLIIGGRRVAKFWLRVRFGTDKE